MEALKFAFDSIPVGSGDHEQLGRGTKRLEHVGFTWVESQKKNKEESSSNSHDLSKYFRTISPRRHGDAEKSRLAEQPKQKHLPRRTRRKDKGKDQQQKLFTTEATEIRRGVVRVQNQFKSEQEENREGKRDQENFDKPLWPPCPL